MICVIILNMFFVVREADLRAQGDVPDWLETLNYIFLVIYSVEITARVSIEKRAYFYEVMNILDVTIVLVDVISNLLDTMLSALSDPPSVSVLRVFRAARLLRVLRASASFRELWLMLHGMGAALKAMGWACVLICIVLLIWSVIAVEVLRTITVDGCEDDPYCHPEEVAEAFADVWESMFTWFLLIFVGEKWPELAVPIMRQVPLTVVIFLSAYVTINLGLMNLILTVIVDRATEARFEDERQKVQEKKDEAVKHKHRLRKICEAMDEDGSGCLTLEEIELGFETNEEFYDTLQLMDIGKEDLKTVFTILDDDNSGSVTYTEFCDHLYKMKTEEAQTMLTFIKYHVEDVHVKVSEQLKMLMQDWSSADVVSQEDRDRSNRSCDFGI